MNPGATAHESRVLLRNASWEQSAALRDQDENRDARMTATDEGALIREFRACCRDMGR